MNNYIYTYNNIIETLVNYNLSGINNNFNDSIISYIDVIKILRKIKSYTKLFIILATASGLKEKQIAARLNRTRQNINKHKHSLIRLLEILQHDR